MLVIGIQFTNGPEVHLLLAMWTSVRKAQQMVGVVILKHDGPEHNKRVMGVGPAGSYQTPLHRHQNQIHRTLICSWIRYKAQPIRTWADLLI